jgi:exodeoxyribonuclease VII large subunit
MQRLDELQARSLAAIRRETRARRERLLRLHAELRSRSPAARLAALSQRIAHLLSRLGSSARHRAAIAQGLVQAVARGLEATSPLATLGRGYAIVTLASDGKVVRDPAEAPPGTIVEARLALGRLRARVLERKS